VGNTRRGNAQMTVVVEQPEPAATPDGVAEVALAAGAATAEVGQLAEDVAEVTAVAEVAETIATDAAFAASNAMGRADEILAQTAVLIEQNAAIMAGLQLIADELSKPEPEPEPEQEPKKRTAPKRKSNAHKFLYGEK
jgi:hypothetical protein